MRDSFSFLKGSPPSAYADGRSRAFIYSFRGATLFVGPRNLSADFTRGSELQLRQEQATLISQLFWVSSGHDSVRARLQSCRTEPSRVPHPRALVPSGARERGWVIGSGQRTNFKSPTSGLCWANECLCRFHLGVRSSELLGPPTSMLHSHVVSVCAF